MSKKHPIAIDLFAGAGGFSLAAQMSGCNMLAAVELDKEACKTYEHNFIAKKLSPNVKVYAKDILNELTPRKLKNDLGLKSGDLDILMGGPPCQGFSSHRINSAGVNDPRNQLLLRYFEYVKELRPKVFLVENVSGMLWKRHENYVEQFKALAKKHDYILYGPQILNAADYGVPQNRKRVFILGIDKRQNLKDFTWPPIATHGPGTKKSRKSASTIFEKPSNEILKKLKDRLVSEVLTRSKNISAEEKIEIKNNIATTVDELNFGEILKHNDTCTIHMKHTDKLKKRFKNTPINGSRTESGEVLPCHSNGYAGHKDVYGRIKLAQPSNTITTGCNNPSKGRFVHPWLNHGITIRHAARLQSFPDTFEFLGSQTSQGKQVGNAVPITLGRALIQHIKNKILD